MRFLKECPPGIFDNGRFCHTACNLLGCVFRVETKEGRTFEGVLQAFSKDFEIALSLVHEIQRGCEDELPREGTVKEKMIFSPQNIVTWTTVADMDAVTKSFATDAEISRFNGELPERKLEAWEPDAHGDDHIIAFDDDANGTGGWSAEDMFERNFRKYGIKTTYNDDLTQFSNVEVQLDETSPEYKLKYAEAERIARSIESNPASKKNAELENDDEERDILPRSSVSSVDSSTTANSNHADPSKYVIPNKRRGGGGVQSDRGGGRSGRGGGPPSTPRGDHRVGGGAGGQGGPKTPRDEYGSGGNLAYYNNAGSGGGHRMGGGGGGAGGGGNVGQKYQQYSQPNQHLPHQQPSHIQHERSPGAAQSGNYTNDRDRTWNQPPRRDGPGGGYPSRQFSHDGPPSNRRDGDVGPNANRRPNNVYNKNQRGDRGDIQELKNFRDNFHLVGQHDSNRPHGQPAPPSSTTTTTAATQQQQPTPMQQQQQSSSSTSVVSPTNRQQTSPLTGQPTPQSQPPLPQRTFQRSPPRHQQQQQHQQNHAAPTSAHQQKSPDSMKTSTKNVGVSSPAQQHQNNNVQQPPPRMEQQRLQQQQQQAQIQQASSYQPQQQTEQEYHHRPQPLTYDQRPPSVGSRGNAPPTPTDSEKSEPSVDIRKSKLNPDAKEFCPSTQFYRPTPVQTPAAGAYPVPVQSPQGIMQQPPPPMSPQQQQPPQIIYSQNIANAQYPPPSASNTITFMQGNGVPVYTINTLSGQPTMAVLHTNGNYRPPRNKLPPQPAVAAATGQPIMTGPYPTQTPYFVQYAPGVQPGQGHPPAAYQPNHYVFGAPRMQYVVQQQTNADGSQQPVYVVPQLVQVTANPYQQATVVHQVPPPGAVQQVQQAQQQQVQQQHPGAPTNVPPPANNNNHSHSVAGHTQTPPAQQQQQTNANTAAISLQSYPPTAQTPQSPQYPVPPGGGYQMVVLPQGGGNFVAAPHMYGGQSAAALAAAAAAAGGHHGHVTGLAGHPSAAGFPTAQAHFVPADAGATAAYMQFPTITPYSQAPSAYPHLMRSSSGSGFMQQPVQSQGQTGVPQHSNMA